MPVFPVSCSKLQILRRFFQILRRRASACLQLLEALYRLGSVEFEEWSVKSNIQFLAPSVKCILCCVQNKDSSVYCEVCNMAYLVTKWSQFSQWVLGQLKCSFNFSLRSGEEL